MTKAISTKIYPEPFERTSCRPRHTLRSEDVSLPDIDFNLVDISTMYHVTRDIANQDVVEELWYSGLCSVR